MRLLAALVALLALAFATPAAAVIAANDIGQNNSNSTSVASLVIALSSPVGGQFTAVAITTGSAAGSLGCSNNNTNSTWVNLGPFVTTGAGRMWLCYTLSLDASATTITVTPSGSTPTLAAAAQFTNITARDATGDATLVDGGATAAGGGSITSGTLAQADELLIGAQTNGSGVNTTAFTPGSGWTALSGVQQAFGNNGIQWAWKETAATTAVTWSPTWTPNQKYGLKIYAFKASGGAAAPTGAGLLLGVGE